MIPTRTFQRCPSESEAGAKFVFQFAPASGSEREVDACSAGRSAVHSTTATMSLPPPVSAGDECLLPRWPPTRSPVRLDPPHSSFPAQETLHAKTLRLVSGSVPAHYLRPERAGRRLAAVARAQTRRPLHGNRPPPRMAQGRAEAPLELPEGQ